MQSMQGVMHSTLYCHLGSCDPYGKIATDRFCSLIGQVVIELIFAVSTAFGRATLRARWHLTESAEVIYAFPYRPAVNETPLHEAGHMKTSDHIRQLREKHLVFNVASTNAIPLIYLQRLMHVRSRA
jgi:hypothetical protein